MVKTEQKENNDKNKRPKPWIGVLPYKAFEFPTKERILSGDGPPSPLPNMKVVLSRSYRMGAWDHLLSCVASAKK